MEYLTFVIGLIALVVAWRAFKKVNHSNDPRRSFEAIKREAERRGFQFRKENHHDQ